MRVCLCICLQTSRSHCVEESSVRARSAVHHIKEYFLCDTHTHTHTYSPHQIHHCLPLPTPQHPLDLPPPLITELSSVSSRERHRESVWPRWSQQADKQKKKTQQLELSRSSWTHYQQSGHTDGDKAPLSRHTEGERGGILHIRMPKQEREVDAPTGCSTSALAEKRK